MTPELSVIVPTRDRAETVSETLKRLAAQDLDGWAEVIVVDDGSRDRTREALDRAAAQLPYELHVVHRASAGGPAAARNDGVEIARAPVHLFLGDDMRPTAGLLARHREFHRLHTAAGEAVLGRIVPGPSADSPFARWLHEQDKQFAFGRMRADEPVPAELFYAANCSLKRELLDAAGGFDESFEFGYEERELAGRLEAAGLRLSYDPEAIAEHDHPTDLRTTLTRMRRFGRSYRQLTDRDTRLRRPRRPSALHRVAATALTAPALLGLRPRLVRERTWEFLCAEASREAFWGEPDPEQTLPPVRVGALLMRLAERDPGVRSAAPAAAKPDRE